MRGRITGRFADLSLFVALALAPIGAVAAHDGDPSPDGRAILDGVARDFGRSTLDPVEDVRFVEDRLRSLPSADEHHVEDVLASVRDAAVRERLRRAFVARRWVRDNGTGLRDPRRVAAGLAGSEPEAVGAALLLTHEPFTLESGRRATLLHRDKRPAVRVAAGLLEALRSHFLGPDATSDAVLSNLLVDADPEVAAVTAARYIATSRSVVAVRRMASRLRDERTYLPTLPSGLEALPQSVSSAFAMTLSGLIDDFRGTAAPPGLPGPPSLSRSAESVARLWVDAKDSFSFDPPAPGWRRELDTTVLVTAGGSVTTRGTGAESIWELRCEALSEASAFDGPRLTYEFRLRESSQPGAEARTIARRNQLLGTQASARDPREILDYAVVPTDRPDVMRVRLRLFRR
jgi:hypothetical protein